jgi:hypothetical protein
VVALTGLLLLPHLPHQRLRETALPVQLQFGRQLELVR